jgi:hypothetical protein
MVGQRGPRLLPQRHRVVTGDVDQAQRLAVQVVVLSGQRHETGRMEDPLHRINGVTPAGRRCPAVTGGRGSPRAPDRLSAATKRSVGSYSARRGRSVHVEATDYGEFVGLAFCG